MEPASWTLFGLDGGGLALGCVAFVLGGLIKGTLGVGLPLVAVPLMSLGMPATRAILLVMVPVLASNVWQLWESGVSAQGVRRFLPLMAMLAIFTLLTVPMTLAMPESTLRTLLAVVVLLAVALNALPLRLNVPPSQERWWSAVVGALSGVMGGVSSLTGPVLISYLMSLRLPREVFVGTVSVIYLCAALPLYGSMLAQGRVGPGDLALSVLAMAPASLGLKLGQRVRRHLSEVLFRRVLLGFLVVIAIALIFR